MDDDTTKRIRQDPFLSRFLVNTPQKWAAVIEGMKAEGWFDRHALILDGTLHEKLLQDAYDKLQTLRSHSHLGTFWLAADHESTPKVFFDRFREINERYNEILRFMIAEGNPEKNQIPLLNLIPTDDNALHSVKLRQVMVDKYNDFDFDLDKTITDFNVAANEINALIAQINPLISPSTQLKPESAERGLENGKEKS